ARVPATTGRASVKESSSAPTPGFLFIVSSVPLNFIRPVSPVTLLTSETAPIVPLGVGLVPSHCRTRRNEGAANFAWPSKKAFWARLALPSKENVAGAGLHVAERAAAPAADKRGGAGAER